MSQLSAADNAMLADFAAKFANIKQMSESNDGISGQLLDARVIANRLGLYDAADYIGMLHLELIRDPETRLVLHRCLSMIPQMAQSQDSTRDQCLRLAVACDVFGLKAAGLELRRIA